MGRNGGRRVGLTTLLPSCADCLEILRDSTSWSPKRLLHILTYLLTYLLNPSSRVLLEKLTGVQLVKKFPAFSATRTQHVALVFLSNRDWKVLTHSHGLDGPGIESRRRRDFPYPSR
jgi:hypothetical protein